MVFTAVVYGSTSHLDMPTKPHQSYIYLVYEIILENVANVNMLDRPIFIHFGPIFTNID